MKAAALDEPQNGEALVTPVLSVEHSKSAFLLGLNKPEIDSIMACATLRHYPAGFVVLNQGDPAQYFCLLRTGCARLFFITHEGRRVLLRWLFPGEIIGAAALLPKPSSYLVSTEMARESSAFVWQRDEIRGLADRYPKLFDNALPFASDHLAWFVASHLALVSHSAGERLANVLISLAQGIGHRVSQGLQLEITNEQLANAANVSPFTVSRFLSEWQRRGTIVKNRGAVVLCDPDDLFACEGM